MLFSKRKLITTGALLIAVLSTTVLAHNKVVVIPLGGDDRKPLKNIITVAKENGDFTDPVAAMDSITDASFDNRYLVIIAPGRYTLTRQLRISRDVKVVGSGRNLTVLIGEISHSEDTDQSALVVMENGSLDLSDISIVNNSDRDNNYSMGIWNDCCGDINNVGVFVGGGIHQTGVGGVSTDILNSTISVSGGLLSNVGVKNAIKIFNSDIRAERTNATGVIAINFGVRISNSSISGTSATTSLDLSNVRSSSRGSRINDSTLSAGITNPSSTPVFCSFVFRNLNLLNSTCQ